MTLAAILAACGDDEGGTSVRDFMKSRGEVEAITLSDIYDRDVSDVAIVCAYTSARMIRNELGFDWRGAEAAANTVGSSDSQQAVIALHEGEVVESESLLMDVLYLCDMDLPYPAMVHASTTLQISWSSTSWSDGTTKGIPETSIG